MKNTKDRIMEVTADFFRQQGYTGTGIKQILAAANAPFGSLYHHFPGGKEDLGAQVIRQSGAMYQQLFETIFEASSDPISAVSLFFTGAAETLRMSDYADACPVATVALEVASTSEPLREATAEVFDGWIAAAEQRFTQAGMAPTVAHKLAIALIAQLEGAFILCRSRRSTDALEIAGESAVAAVRAALSNPAAPTRRKGALKSGKPSKPKKA